MFRAETSKAPCSFTTGHVAVWCISDRSRKALKERGNARRSSDFEGQAEPCAGEFMALSGYQGNLGYKGISWQSLWSLLVQIPTGTLGPRRSLPYPGSHLAGATIAGFVPGFLKPRDPSLYYIEESKELFYPYKTLPNGKHIPVAPWEVLLALGILAITYYLVFVNPEMGALWAKTLAAVILGCLFVLLVLKSSAPRLTARLVGAFWNNVCPPLVVLNEEESKS